jgi:hypothetical protein
MDGVEHLDEDSYNLAVDKDSDEVVKAQHLIDKAEGQIDAAEDSIDHAEEELDSYMNERFENMHGVPMASDELITENTKAVGPVVDMGDDIEEDAMKGFCEMFIGSEEGRHAMADGLKEVTNSEKIYKESKEECCPTCECDPCECSDEEDCGPKEFNEQALIKESADIWANASGVEEEVPELTDQEKEEMAKDAMATDMGDLPIDDDGDVEADLLDQNAEDVYMGGDEGLVEDSLIEDFPMEEDLDDEFTSIDDDFTEDDIYDLPDDL